MIVKIQKWGNSLALRIPIAFARETGMDSGVDVDLSLEEGRLVITPMSPDRYDLAELLSEITPENLHSEIPTSGPLGNEVW